MADPKRLTVSYGSFTCTVEGFDEPFRVMKLVVDYFQSLTSLDPAFGAQPRRLDPQEVSRRAAALPGMERVEVALDPECEGAGIILRNGSAAATAAAGPDMPAPALADEAPAAGSAPAADAVPVADPAPAADAVPEADATPATEDTPKADATPADADPVPAPVADADPVPAPAAEDMPADGAAPAAASGSEADALPEAGRATLPRAEAIPAGECGTLSRLGPDRMPLAEPASEADPLPAAMTAPAAAELPAPGGETAPGQAPDRAEAPESLDAAIGAILAAETGPAEDPALAGNAAALPATEDSPALPEAAIAARKAAPADGAPLPDDGTAPAAAAAGTDPARTEGAAQNAAPAADAAQPEEEFDLPAAAAPAQPDPESRWRGAFAPLPPETDGLHRARLAAARNDARQEEEALGRVLRSLEERAEAAAAATESTLAGTGDEPRPPLPGLSAGLAPHRRITLRKRPPVQLDTGLQPLPPESPIGAPWKALAAAGAEADTPPAPQPAPQPARFRIPLAERLFGRRPGPEADEDPASAPAPAEPARDSGTVLNGKANGHANGAGSAGADLVPEADMFDFDEEEFIARTMAAVEGAAPGAQAGQPDPQAGQPDPQPERAGADDAPPPSAGAAPDLPPLRLDRPLEAPAADPEPARAAARPAAQRLSVVARRPDPAAPANSELREFARRMGAASLPELLEASAAYTTLVRGQPRFSRRDIMLALDEIGAEESFTQEARIKSFGRLLRKGSIVRVDDGRFALSRTTRSSYEERLSAAG